ncbi:mechanosensitive ion channel family protein [Streptomyces sp. NPDC126499]|uniref:mechanosensitive ion channel family protein n=1 Tax=Streptomyces sp. NPDC126499 TaxID=3155314 RepID=UPI003323D07C
MSQPLALSVDFGKGFTDAWSAVAEFVPKFIGFLAILLIGWFVAKVIARVADRLLRKVGFERMAERSGAANALKGSKYDATGIIAKILYYAILLIALQLAFGVFGPNPVSVMINGIVAWLPRAIVAVVIVVVAMAIARAVRDIVTGALGQMSYGKVVATAAWAFIVALGVIAALSQAGIATAITGPVLTAVLAMIAGVVIVGVGGGLITPMRSRWERWLAAAESETGRAKDQISAYQRGRQDAQRGMPAPQERMEQMERRPGQQQMPGQEPLPGQEPGQGPRREPPTDPM